MKKRLLITGGAGFIAHHVLYYFLKNTDFDIVSLDRLDFSGNLDRIDQILVDCSNEEKSRVSIVYHDLKAELNDYVKEKLGNINFIFHMAASSHVTRSIKYPLEFIHDNVLGTANILEYSRTLKYLERFIYFSTDEVFGSSINNISFSEWDRFNSGNPYSASKAAAEEICIAYENTYKLPIYITHTMNVFGERQSDEKYIPMTIKKILNNESINIHFDSKTGEIGSRTYLYAKDVAECLLFIMNLREPIPFPKNHYGGKCHKFNIVSSDLMNNLEMAELIANSLSKKLQYKLVDANIERPGHDFKYLISGDYLKSLGWIKKTPIEMGISKVTNYILEKSL